MIFISSCKKDDKPEEDQNGKLVFNFSHVVNGEDIVFDTMKYVNAAGNPYLVNEIQYFISDVTLYKSDGSQMIIDDWKDIWYVDTDLPDTWHWQMKDDIPVGTYDSITFRFGISEEKNHLRIILFLKSIPTLEHKVFPRRLFRRAVFIHTLKMIKALFNTFHIADIILNILGKF
jgi:hypothetical protein